LQSSSHINAFICHVNENFRVSDGAVSQSENRAAICKEVVRLLSEARKAKGLSMNQLAKEAGLTQPAISILEASQPNPKLDTLLRLAAALEVDLGEVVSRALNAKEKRPNKTG
jgi:ribosome-binding protein aMBF1 (putative translation factor)